jgi:hypothetical protein
MHTFQTDHSASAIQMAARFAGIAYLVIIVLGAFGELYVRGSLVVSGNPHATAANITSSLSLWRAGLVGDLLMHVLDVPLIVFFYWLLRPVDPMLALTATAFNIVQTSVLVANKLTLLVAIVLPSSATVGAAADQAALWVALAVSIHGYGFGIGLIFFGFACVIRGVLILRSDLLPRFLGTLLVAAGVAYLVNSIALLSHPKLAAFLFPWILVPPLIGELALALWLIAKGIHHQAWAQLHEPSVR